MSASSKKGKSAAAVAEKALESLVKNPTQSQQKKKKKKASTWSKILKGGLKIAGDVAPVALPLALSLLANHGNNPGVCGSRNIRNLQAVASATPNVPMASTVPQNFSSPGMFSVTEQKDAYGKVFAVTATGRESLGPITIPNNSNPGDVVFNVGLQPLSGLLLGTRLSNIAASYGRFRVKGCSLVIISSLAATQAGQLVAAILSDPQQEIPLTGGSEANIRVLSDSAGSDVFQVWSSGIAVYPGNQNVDPFYTNPLTVDDYLTSGGVGYVATMDANSSGSAINVGEVFLDYEFEFSEPTLEVYATVSKLAIIHGALGASSCTDALPLGSSTAPSLSYDAVGITGLTGAGFDVPPGNWWVGYNLTVATSIVNTMNTFMTALQSAATADGGDANWVITGQPNNSTLPQLGFVFNLTVQQSVTIPFQNLMTGMTGENVQANTVWVFSDPTSFPSLSNQRRIKQINEQAVIACEAACALEREQRLSNRVMMLEELLLRKEYAATAGASTSKK